ncbi:MAG: high-affinity iron transporter [Paraglaciecola sp.]|jgi:high-affinity iron transporter
MMMLINTVILFLRDALPVFVLMAFLLAFWQHCGRSITIGCAVGLVVTTLIVLERSTVSQYFEGAGYELLKCLTLITAFCLSAVILSTSNIVERHCPKLVITLLVAFTFIPHSADFSVFLVGFSSQKDALTPILLGTFLGGGICASVAVLLNLLLTSLKQKRLSQLMFAIFAAGQISNCPLLLQQIDWIPDPGALWNSQFISDESEYGHLLKALMGYEAAPSIIYIAVYATALMLLIGISFYASRRGLTQQTKSERTS